MDGIAIARRPRRDWTTWSLADLTILVAGCALAMSLPWMQDPSAQVKLMSGPAPGWFTPLAVAGEVLMKSALALLPLAIWKRAQLGGIIRPGEFLLALCTAPLLAEEIERTAWIRDSYYLGELPNDLGFRWMPGGPFWYAHLAAAAVSAGSMLALILGRKRMPMGARSALLVSAYLGAVPWIMEGFAELQEQYIAPALRESPTVLITLEFAHGIAFAMIPAAIGVAALRDRLWRHPASPLEWIGSAIGLVVLARSLFASGYLSFFNRASAIGKAEAILIIGLPLVCGALGLVIVRWLGPAWGRWIGAECHPEE